MTAQFSDLFEYQDKEYSITTIKGGELFHPAQFGLLPVSTCTACWRGFVSTFEIENNSLLLKNLDINLENNKKKFSFWNKLPRINNVKPTGSGSLYGMFDYHFQNIKLKLSFSGWILLGDGFIQELYSHMGFHPAWKYNSVYKLTFENGNLVRSSNVSEAMKKSRVQNSQLNEKGNIPGGKEPDGWLEDYLSKQ